MVPNRNIYEQERHNRRLTAALLVGFVVLLGVVGLGVDVFYFHMPTPWRPRARGPAFPVATFLAVAIAGASGWWSYRCGDQAILASTHARPAPHGIGLMAYGAGPVKARRSAARPDDGAGDLTG